MTRGRHRILVTVSIAALAACGGSDTEMSAEEIGKWAEAGGHLVGTVKEDFEVGLSSADSAEEVGNLCQTMATRIETETAEMGDAPDAEGDRILDDFVRSLVDVFDTCSGVRTMLQLKSVTDEMSAADQRSDAAADRLIQYLEGVREELREKSSR